MATTEKTQKCTINFSYIIPEEDILLHWMVNGTILDEYRRRFEVDCSLFTSNVREKLHKMFSAKAFYTHSYSYVAMEHENGDDWSCSLLAPETDKEKVALILLWLQSRKGE